MLTFNNVDGQHSDMNCLSHDLAIMTLYTRLKFVTVSRFFVDNYFTPPEPVLRACKYKHTDTHTAVQLAKLSRGGKMFDCCVNCVERCRVFDIYSSAPKR